MKTRVIAEVLESAGFKTRIVERRLLTDTRRGTTEPPLALIGVDKVEPRRLISDVGWTFAVDVGLGAGPIDFTGISIHTFPATPSNEVPAWRESGTSQRAERAQKQTAYRAARAEGADACGLVQLAETAVAAPFVGVVAACLALAEPLRVLHGQHPNIALTFDVGRSAPAAVDVRGHQSKTRLRGGRNEQLRLCAGPSLQVDNEERALVGRASFRDSPCRIPSAPEAFRSRR